MEITSGGKALITKGLLCFEKCLIHEDNGQVPEGKWIVICELKTPFVCL